MDTTTKPHEYVMNGRAACSTCAYWHKLTTTERNPRGVQQPLKEGQCRIRRKVHPTDGDHWCGEYYPDTESS